MTMRQRMGKGRVKKIYLSSPKRHTGGGEMPHKEEEDLYQERGESFYLSNQERSIVFFLKP
jgi:hypothetical protein